MLLRLCGRIAFALALPVAAATAGETVVIYRCTDASGASTYQNDVPCSQGAKQVRRVMEVASPVSAPLSVRPAPAERAPPPSAPVAPVEPPGMVPAAERLPPPALFACRTWDDARYFTDDSAPIERCAPLQTTGIGGAPGMGTGAACEMVVDTCQQVAEEALCESWHLRLREAEATLRFGRYDSREAAEAEIERVARISSQSTCAN